MKDLNVITFGPKCNKGPKCNNFLTLNVIKVLSVILSALIMLRGHKKISQCLLSALLQVN